MKVCVKISAGLLTTLVMLSSCFQIPSVEINWGFVYPPNWEQLYHHDADPTSFNGDGARYTVVEFDHDITESDVGVSVEWRDIDDEARLKMSEILQALTIDEAFSLDFGGSKKYCALSKSDSSVVYFLFDQTDNRLFVIEDFR